MFAKKTGAKKNAKETRSKKRFMHESFWLSIDYAKETRTKKGFMHESFWLSIID